MLKSHEPGRTVLTDVVVSVDRLERNVSNPLPRLSDASTRTVEEDPLRLMLCDKLSENPFPDRSNCSVVRLQGRKVGSSVPSSEYGQLLTPGFASGMSSVRRMPPSGRPSFRH